MQFPECASLPPLSHRLRVEHGVASCGGRSTEADSVGRASDLSR